MLSYKLHSLKLCDDFVKEAQKVWNWLKISHLTNIKISEESITDFILLDLQSKHPKEIITKKFSRFQESKIGADWEWWFNSGNNWLGLSIQAKKLDVRNLEYPELNKSKGEKQLDALINTSFSRKPKTIPLYVFYNYWTPYKYLPPGYCSFDESHLNILGCSIVYALKIKELLNKNRNKLKDIARYMYPWSCLSCYNVLSNEDKDLPNRAYDFLKNAFNLNFSKDEVIVRNPPNYVYKILERSKLTDEDWGQIEFKYITIIREK